MLHLLCLSSHSVILSLHCFILCLAYSHPQSPHPGVSVQYHPLLYHLHLSPKESWIFCFLNSINTCFFFFFLVFNIQVGFHQSWMLFEDSTPGGNTTVVKSVATDENCHTFSLPYTLSSPLLFFFFFLWTRSLAWERPLLTAVFCAVAFVDIIYGGVTVSNSPSLIWILYILFGFRDPSEWSHALPVCLS